MSQWKALEPLIVEDALRALRELLAEHPHEQFYAAAFQNLYRELDGPVYLPGLSANSVEARDGEPSGDFWEADWNPPDWRWDDIDFQSPALTAAAEAASNAVQQDTRAGWLAAERECIDMLVAASQKIRAALGNSPQLTPDFVVFLHDMEDGGALARRCIGESAYFALFPVEAKNERERQRVAALPVAERVDWLVGRLNRFDGAINSEEATEQLCAIGAPAVPALLARMGNSKSRHGWESARLLGRIGVATPEVLAALQKQMATSRDQPTREWSARALAYLGQSDWLLEQLARAGNPMPALLMIEGLCAPYSSFRDPTPLPLDYRPLETLLAGPASTVDAVLDILKPGRGYCTLRPGEVDEALRGLGSPHVFLRRHAASLFNDRGLGTAVGERALPLLAERLAHDDDAVVRWEAVESLRAWKRACRPWRPIVERAARQDTHKRVRDAAQFLLDDAAA